MWLKSILFFLLAAFVILACADVDIAWNSFKKSHTRNYMNASEDARRKELFMKADALIKKHNNGNHTWKMKHTKFSDMTTQEKAKFFGAKVPNTFREQHSKLEPYQPTNRVDLPASVDYRTDKCLAAVKDQKGCGSCWAFSALNPIEFANCKAHGNKLKLLSEQHLVDCVYDRTGCTAGWMETAYWHLMNAQTVGVAKNCSYPYTAEYSGGCLYKSTMKGAQLTSYRRIGGDTWKDVARNIMEALVNNGTISVAVFVPDEWSFYASGVFFNTTDCDQSVNHAVNIVGYGTLDNNDYWVIRNQWGTGWGDKGYMLMRRGVNQCRIEEDATCVSVA